MKFHPLTMIRHFDWLAGITTMVLMVVSLIMLYSIALGSDDPVDMFNFKKQIAFVLIGFSVYVAVALFLDYRQLAILSPYLYVIGILVLIALLFFGKTIRGTTGWFDFGIFSVQPVEFVKIILVIFMAKFLSTYGKFIPQLKYVLFSALSVAIIIALIMAQPDFGSSMVILSVWFALVVLAGMRLRHIITIISSAIGSGVILWFFVFAEYQKNRILVFLDSSRDPLGVGYNITQAIIAIGSGQWFGRGLSFGSQSKLKFLPEAQTDFIFAVIAEQLGLFGVIVIISLYGVLFWRLWSTAREVKDNFGIFIILGVLLLLFVQMIINIGMNLGLLPVTGLTLPLLSYGGSSVLSSLILLGLAQAVVMRNRL